jgi:periplasmic divalent cation tolerance protein
VAVKSAHPVVILTTLPDKVAAEKLALLLVENKLAACVNIFPQIESVYFWDNQLMRDSECKLFIKSSSTVQEKAVIFIKQNHPYTVPEITVIGHSGVTMQSDYWAWLTGYVGG